MLPDHDHEVARLTSVTWMFLARSGGPLTFATVFRCAFTLLVFRRGCFRAAGFGCPLGVREVMVRGCELSCGRVLAAGLVIWTIANLLMVLPSLRGHRIRLGHVLALQAGGFRLVNVRCPGVPRPPSRTASPYSSRLSGSADSLSASPVHAGASKAAGPGRPPW